MDPVESKEDIEVMAPLDNTSGDHPPHKLARKLQKEFFLFATSILLTMCSFAGLLDLQSSINISGALGNTSLTLTSVTTIVVCLLFAPVIVIYLGAKKTVILSQVCYLIYVVSNFYPSKFK